MRNALIALGLLACVSLALAYDPYLVAQRTAYQRLVGVGAGELWTPADLGDDLVAWWDVQDFDSISTNSFGVYEILNQVSGGQRAYHNTTSEYPAYSATGLNGYPAIDFGVGGTRRLFLDSGFDTTSRTYVSVFDRDSSGDISVPFGGWSVPQGGVVAPVQWISSSRLGPVMAGYFRLKNTQTQTGDFISVSFAETSLASLGLVLNGTEIADYDLTGSVSMGNVTALGYSIDADVQTHTGRIGEWLIIDGVLSETDRQRVEGFLAHKWGLTANLPANHPYKDNAPTK